MTQTSIKEQVNAINLATEKALESKEAAIEFLTAAGIITPDENTAKENESNSAKHGNNWDNTSHSK